MWANGTNYPTSTERESCVTSGGYIYCIGGDQGTGANAVAGSYYAQTPSAGIGAWIQTTSYPSGLEGQSCVTTSSPDYIYCIGGAARTAGATVFNPTTLSNIVEYTPISVPPSLIVGAQNTRGQTIGGPQAVLYQNGGAVEAGVVPATFTLNDGQPYTIQVDDYGSCHFARWADTGSTSPSRAISISTNTRLTAIYNCGTASASSVTVNSVDQNGNAIFGYYTILSRNGNTIATGFTTKTFSTVPGQVYKVQVDNYGSCRFSKWSNGLMSDPLSFTATSGPISLTAIYRC